MYQSAFERMGHGATRLPTKAILSQTASFKARRLTPPFTQPMQMRLAQTPPLRGPEVLTMAETDRAQLYRSHDLGPERPRGKRAVDHRGPWLMRVRGATAQGPYHGTRQGQTPAAR